MDKRKDGKERKEEMRTTREKNYLQEGERLSRQIDGRKVIGGEREERNRRKDGR